MLVGGFGSGVAGCEHENALKGMAQTTQFRESDEPMDG